VVNQILRRLGLQEKQRCDLELPAGFGAGTHKSETDVLYAGEG
jgi:hypothetical protein